MPLILIIFYMFVSVCVCSTVHCFLLCCLYILSCAASAVIKNDADDYILHTITDSCLCDLEQNVHVI